MTTKDELRVSEHSHDFSRLHRAMQRYVDDGVLAGISSAVIEGSELVDLHCAGWADKAHEIELREHHIFRVFSNTKLVTACAALSLYEEGRFDLNEPVEQYIPELANRRVLRPGATHADDTEPASNPITIRQVMCHSSGFTTPLLHPDAFISTLYNERKIASPAMTLAEAMDVFGELPLAFHPGAKWDYSLGMDVIARLCEILSGDRFDHFIKSRVLEPLGMVDTGYLVPEAKRDRLVAFYHVDDPVHALTSGLTESNNAPYPDANLTPVARFSGNFGLVSTLADMVALLRSLMPGNGTLLKPDTIAMMTTNQFPNGIQAEFPWLGQVPGYGFSYAGAITMTPGADDPESMIGEYHWGGVGGPHWWVSPGANIAGVMMTQRMPAFWHPFYFELKRLAYDAVA